MSIESLLFCPLKICFHFFPLAILFSIQGQREAAGKKATDSSSKKEALNSKSLRDHPLALISTIFKIPFIVLLSKNFMF